MLYGIRAKIISEIDAEAKESFGTELATCKLSTTQLCAAFGSAIMCNFALRVSGSGCRLVAYS